MSSKSGLSSAFPQDEGVSLPRPQFQQKPEGKPSTLVPVGAPLIQRRREKTQPGQLALAVSREAVEPKLSGAFPVGDSRGPGLHSSTAHPML
jgi:hypothetical protein